MTYEELGLTPRQAEVARLMRAGKSNKEIAIALNTTLSNVRAHITNIFRVLKITDRLDLIRVIKAR